jgi:hypothetical protein
VRAPAESYQVWNWIFRATAIIHEFLKPRFVTCEGNGVAGYYSLSSSSIVHEIVPGRFRRNMPNPIPTVLLGRSVVWRLTRMRGIVVQAISDEARKFYVAIGFSECPHEPMTLVVTLQDIRAAIGV